MMSVEMSPNDVAGVLNLVYRARSGRPHRFWISSEELRKFAPRKRLRWEFFDQVGAVLEVYSLLMSYPRLSAGSLLGFASTLVAETWPHVTDRGLTKVPIGWIKSEWTATVRRRIKQIWEIETDGTRPLVLSERQMCQFANQTRITPQWWAELMDSYANVPNPQRLVFFCFGIVHERRFAVCHEEQIRKWQHLSFEDWELAVSRYHLDEADER
jgi:hypothetical protein